MNRRTNAMRTSLLLAFTGVLALTGHSHAQSNADYAAQPQFVSNVVTPNILIIMDNSGSMSNRACESTSCGILAGGGTSTVTTFVATTRYNGFADPLRCYTWDATDNRFEIGTAKAALNTACPATQWDGNFVNWATFRRFDAVKKAMTGGNCWNPTTSPARNPDGTCKPYGTPSARTVKAQNLGTGDETTPAVPYAGGTGDTTYVGRIPTAVHPGNPANLFFQYEADGDLCVDDDNGGGCPDGGGFAETELNEIAFEMPSEPTGVIQQVGNKARFGLAVFNGSGANDGLQVLTPVASRQSINFNGTSVETFNTNTAAMIDSVDEASPATWTPLAETLYDAVRYVAQVNSAYYPTSYVYPIAFSGAGSSGVSFATNGIGSIGTSEISVLTGSETCPAGYIASACGRDPFFFGSNHTPAWASTSQPVNCCKTFVIVFTDGEPTQDQNIPAALQDYGHAHHGVHCTNSDGAAPPRPIDGTCNTNVNTPWGDLLGEHRTDYASSGSGFLDSVAYWAHTTDLRPCSGTGDGTIAVIGVTGHCLPGTQNVSVYTFFAFGNINGRSILAQAAKLGAFEDSNNDGIPQTNEWDKENNYTGVSTPDGIPDAYFESSNVDDLQDKMLATIASILRKSAAGSSVSVLATSTAGEGALYQSYFYPSTLESSTLKDVTWTGYTQSLFIDTFGNLREDTNNDKRLIYNQDKILVTRYDTVANLVKVDYYDDANSDGLPDDKNGDNLITNLDCNPCNQLLGSIKPIWEAGNQLALKDASTRTILTWVDLDNDGLVDTGEQIPFTTANSATLSPYLRAGAAPFTATAIINFIRGCEPSVCAEQASLRDRRLQVPAGSGTLKTWKLGDLIHSTPIVVATPTDRFDAVFGDLSYEAYLAKYHNRRQVIYAGANDGMLHAFNGGYYHPGDNPATGTVASPIVEHGWFTRTPTDDSSGPQLGEELWGFIPYQLLPQLQWLTRADYQHVYYVDLQPTVADVRIFTPDTDHPNGWGTILIGGFRMGGSCNACTAGSGGPKMTVNISGTNRDFFSAYFVLDITNPEVSPKLLWSFASPDLGLTTSVPRVVRVNPTADNLVSNTNAKWYLVVGSGPTGYDGSIAQSARVFAINLATGPGSGNTLVQPFTVGSWNSFIGDIAAFDRNVDYRTDAVYFGRVIHDGSLPWRGKLYRLTMGSTAPYGGQASASQWGVASGGNRIPTEILDSFTGTCSPAPCTAPTIEMGPVATAPGIAIDDNAKVWVFAGSGRYYSASDKTDMTNQYFVGIKDSVINNQCTQTTGSDCIDNDLLDVTSATVCIVGQGNCGLAGGTNQVTGVTGATSFTSLISLIQSKDGWFTKLPQSGAANGERVLASPVVFGGIVFFPTFIPTNDICASSGTSYLYALYYKTGSAYSESIIGTTPGGSGNSNVLGKMSLGEGLAFGGVTHIGSQADGGAPFKLCNNTSTGALVCNDHDIAGGGDDGGGGGGGGSGSSLDPRSRFISWLNR